MLLKMDCFAVCTWILCCLRGPAVNLTLYEMVVYCLRPRFMDLCTLVGIHCMGAERSDIVE